MTRAFVLGNGTSRRTVSVSALHELGRIYGCNALYREFVPDVLVATDQPIATAIQDSGYAQTNEFYTRRPMPGTGAQRLLEPYRGYSSGPNALALAAQQGNLEIYLLGFDMGPTENNLFNNVYADTEFYKTSAHPPTFVGNWVRQVIQVFRDHPQVQFTRVYGATTARIAELDLVPNLKHIDLATFMACMDNQPDNH
jgi:hypothetical protein